MSRISQEIALCISHQYQDLIRDVLGFTGKKRNWSDLSEEVRKYELLGEIIGSAQNLINKMEKEACK